MHKNMLWQGFLAFVLLVTFWYTGKAYYHYYIYSHLSETIPPKTILWDIEQEGEEKFILKASYQFQVGKDLFSGTTSWSNEPYLNHYAAESIGTEYSKLPWLVYYDPTNPNRSSLVNHFPIKDILSSIFLWILLLYFLWLGYYVTKFKINP